MNVCVSGSHPRSCVQVCMCTTMRCVRASGSQLTWGTLPTEVWGWLLGAHTDVAICHKQAWDTHNQGLGTRVGVVCGLSPQKWVRNELPFQQELGKTSYCNPLPATGADQIMKLHS